MMKDENVDKGNNMGKTVLPLQTGRDDLPTNWRNVLPGYRLLWKLARSA